jgi:hypothetical protein
MLSYPGQYTIPLGTAANGDADVVVVVVVMDSVPSLQVDSSSSWECNGSGSGPTGGDDSFDDGRTMDGIVVSASAARALIEQEEVRRIIAHNAHFHGHDARKRGALMWHVVRIMLLPLALMIFEGLLVLVMGVKFCHDSRKKVRIEFYLRTRSAGANTGTAKKSMTSIVRHSTVRT